MNTQPVSKPLAPTSKDDEIDLLALVKTFWNGRKTILLAVLFAGILGVLIALLSAKEYTSSTIMVPQTSQSGSKLGGLSSLAALAGFNLDNMGGSGETMSPLVYPQIVSSVNYQLELMDIPFNFSDVDHRVSLYDYYTNIAKPGVLSSVSKYTIGLPFLLIKAIKGKETEAAIPSDLAGPVALTEEQDNVRKLIEAKVTLDLDAKQGFLTLSASFHEALLSAQVADQARELLQKYITRYKIEKASSQLAFIEERYQEKKKEFEKSQVTLARFRDQNKNVSSALAQTEEQRLQSEFSIAMNVYNELAKQLEQAKIQVKEETPVFSVLQPAMIPREKTKPKKAMIVFIWLFLGGIIGTGIVFGKEYLGDIKQKWNEER
ncbi:MAG TPA: Wzz/FepE/Etk N-terminal domain-containing protein [Prolixibacteraceae bacterium]|nr:Wzz/FepE/Etk N-terminal domain-containing protein [Prolixibacteraceae bacterium]